MTKIGEIYGVPVYSFSNQDNTEKGIIILPEGIAEMVMRKLCKDIPMRDIKSKDNFILDELNRSINSKYSMKINGKIVKYY